MSSRIKLVLLAGAFGLLAACAPPPPEPEPIMVPVMEEEPMGKYG